MRKQNFNCLEVTKMVENRFLGVPYITVWIHPRHIQKGCWLDKLPCMRKRLITPKPQDAPSPNENWLDLDSAAVVEVTSEEKGYPVESALVSGERRGWRAADSGTQTIRLVFEVPQRIRRIWLVFEETETERIQEFVLRWFSDGGHSSREIVRQQWNFSPPETTRETEDYQVELSDVTVLELVIVPDKNG
jgi:hypothetical protein